MKTRKPLPRSTKPIKRSRVRPVNAKRKAKNRARAYGPAARVEWVKTLACAACGVVGFSENAHVVSGGMSRKADAFQIVPLCGPRRLNPTLLWEGCHGELHRVGRRDFEARHGVSLAEQAELTEFAWQSRGGSESGVLPAASPKTSRVAPPTEGNE